jgi:hypothetical protein
MTGNYSLPSTPVFSDLVGTQAAGRRGELDAHVRLSDDQLARLRAAAELRRFTTGEVLLEPGERDYPFKLLGQGRAEVVGLATPDRPETVLDGLSQGDFAANGA